MHYPELLLFLALFELFSGWKLNMATSTSAMTVTIVLPRTVVVSDNQHSTNASVHLISLHVGNVFANGSPVQHDDDYYATDYVLIQGRAAPQLGRNNRAKKACLGLSMERE